MENSTDDYTLQFTETVSSVSMTGNPETFRFEFHGSASEYFMIWFVNLFLTIVTFGIYAPWAKVRTKKYMYRNTILNGEPFDYTGNPIAILKGYLIITAVFIPVAVLQGIMPGTGSIIMVLAYLGILPYLIYKSLKFNARNLLYRNIRCSFRGTVSESYTVNAGIAILIPFTLGLIFPYWDYRKKRYMFSGLAYGNEAFTFNGRTGAFYRYYIIASLFPVSIIIALLVFFSFLDISSLNENIITLAENFPGISIEVFRALIIACISSVYLIFIFSVIAVKQYLFVRLTNYMMNHLNLARSVVFHSEISLFKYLWIQAVNSIAIFLSMGLLYPWSKIRKMKYVMESLSMTTYSGFDAFMAVAEPDVSAVGDAGADFFDVDIAL